MKKILAAVLSLLCAASVFAFDNDDSIVRWRSIVGVITAPAVDNPVGSIRGGAGPWSVRSGRASVDLVAGNASFDVEGLVLNGGTASGTPGPVSAVTGTLVCNAGTQTQAILDTAVVPLNVHGDAHFAGHLQNNSSTLREPIVPRADRDSGRRCGPLDCDWNRAFHW